MSAAATKFGAKAAPADPTRIPPGIDINTFFAPQTIADDVRACVPIMHALATNTDIFRAALELVRNFIVGSNSSVSDENFEAIQAKVSKALSGDEFSLLCTGLYSIIRFAVYGKTPLTKINNDLKSMNVPAAAADDITRVTNAVRTHIEQRSLGLFANTHTLVSKVTPTTAATSSDAHVGFAHLHKLRWRIDVTISSGSLTRVMRPSLVMQLSLSNGLVKTFEVSVEQFNQLRYSVAKVLHHMRTLERHPIMKIIREFEKKEDADKNK